MGSNQSPLAGLFSGIVNGYGLRQQLLNYKQQNEAYTRKAALDESNASIQDIINRQAFEQNTRPIVNGMVQAPVLSRKIEAEGLFRRCAPSPDCSEPKDPHKNHSVIEHMKREQRKLLHP